MQQESACTKGEIVDGRRRSDEGSERRLRAPTEGHTQQNSLLNLRNIYKERGWWGEGGRGAGLSLNTSKSSHHPTIPTPHAPHIAPLHCPPTSHLKLSPPFCFVVLFTSPRASTNGNNHIILVSVESVPIHGVTPCCTFTNRKGT